MDTLKAAGLVAAGAGLAALVGGGIWWWRKRKKDAEQPEMTPSRPPRRPKEPAREDLEPDERPSRAATTKPRGHHVERGQLDPALTDFLDKNFKEAWPPDEATIEELEKDDVVIFGVESEEIGNYTETRQELVSAKVLSVERSTVRARIYGEVEHAEHHGSHAGHGFRIGDLVEVPRSKVLVAARRTDADATGYGSQGAARATFEPSNSTKRVYTVKPGTPYDLELPYRTEDLAWSLDRELVKIAHIGDKGLIEQIMFSEDSLRGEVSLRAIDHDAKAGQVFVARWDFALES